MPGHIAQPFCQFRDRFFPYKNRFADEIFSPETVRILLSLNPATSEVEIPLLVQLLMQLGGREYTAARWPSQGCGDCYRVPTAIWWPMPSMAISPRRASVLWSRTQIDHPRALSTRAGVIDLRPRYASPFQRFTRHVVVC